MGQLKLVSELSHPLVGQVEPINPDHHILKWDTDANKQAIPS